MRSGALVLALFVLPAGAGAPAHAVTSSPVVIQVTIDQVAFKESSVTAHVGDTIEWTNRDVIDHTATAKTHEFDVEIPAGKKARVVLKKTGTIEYYCQYHPNMTAKIVVTAPR
jgi:plastocyanin